MVLRLYKTLFWISFAVMLLGVCTYSYEIYDNTNNPTAENIVLHKVKTNSPFYNRSLLEATTESDIAEAREDMKSSGLVYLLGYYEYKNALAIAAFFFQFLALIILKKWFSWVLAKPQT